MRLFLATTVSILTLIAAAHAAPSADTILKANQQAAGGSAWNSKATLKTIYDFSGQGLTGITHSLTDLKTGNFADDYDLKVTSGANGFDGNNAWQKEMSGTVTLQQGGEQKALAVNESYRRANKWWRADRGGAQIALGGEKADGGRKYDVLTVTPAGGKAFEAWFDEKTHQLGRTVEKQGAETVTTTLSDYRPEGGVVLAHKAVIDDGSGAKYLQTVTLAKAEFLPEQPAGAYSAPKINVSDFAIAGGAGQTVIPIEIVNNHIYGHAMVDGKGPYTFIFDTGGHNLVVPSLAKDLGLKVEGSLPGHGAGEGIMEGGFTKVQKLSVGDASVADQAFLVLPLDTLGNIEGKPMPGMVGFEMFRRFVTRIDYGAHTLTLIDPKAFDPKDAGTPIKFTFNEHIPEVMGTFEGLPAKFDIDTGARGELTVTKPFAEEHNLRAKHPKGVDAVDGWGVGGASRGYVTRASEITIGPFKLDGIVASFSTQNKGAMSGEDYQGNVGGGILKRFVVTFDYEHQTMYLKPLKGPLDDVSTFDRSGMWINQVADGFQIVDITPKGPAEAAGLKANDVITAVDGKTAAGIPLYELRKRLRNDAPGTKVTFTIRREGGSRDIAVTLKDQI